MAYPYYNNYPMQSQNNYYPQYQQQTNYNNIPSNNLNQIYNQTNSQYTSQNNLNNNPLQGRIVNDFNEITAAEVPMNGTIATFVKADLSQVQTRFWNQEGKIVPCTYERVDDAQSSVESSATMETLNADIKQLIDKIDKIEKYIGNSSNFEMSEVIANE